MQEERRYENSLRDLKKKKKRAKRRFIFSSTCIWGELSVILILYARKKLAFN